MSSKKTSKKIKAAPAGAKKKWSVSATVVGSTYLGEFEAETGNEAINKAMESAAADVSFCHQCSRGCEGPEILEAVAERDIGPKKFDVVTADLGLHEFCGRDWEAKARAAGWRPPEEEKASNG